MIGIQCCCFRSHIYHVRGRQLNPQSNTFLFPITNSLTHSLSLKHLEPGCAVTYRKERQRHPHSDRDCCPSAETAFPQELPSKTHLTRTEIGNSFIYLFIYFCPCSLPAHFFIDRNHLFLARVQIEWLFVFLPASTAGRMA